MNDVNPEYVVIGEGRTYSLDTLTRAVNLVLGGAKLIGANSDVSGNIECGIAPACRALIAPVEMATGKQAYFCGKPNPLMMRTDGYGHHCRYGKRHRYGVGPLRCVRQRHAEGLCLSAHHDPERSRGHQQGSRER